MAIEQSEAVVLRTYPVGDQDKIAVFFTRDKGLLRGVAKGARKFGNRFGSSLEPMSIVRVIYYEKERRDLVTVSACDLLESFFEVQNELKTSLTLSYFAELVEEFAPARAKDDVLFRLLLAVLHCLKAGGDPIFLASYFEAWLLLLHGVLPDLGRCKACRKELPKGWMAPRKDGAYCEACAPLKKEEVPGEAAAFLAWVRKNPPGEPCPRPVTPGTLDAVRKTLQSMIIFHLEREPKTLRYLKN